MKAVIDETTKTFSSNSSSILTTLPRIARLALEIESGDLLRWIVEINEGKKDKITLENLGGGSGKKINLRKPISPTLRHEVFKRDDYRCLECGATNKEVRLHVDHIKPVSKGGTDELDNLQTLCAECNMGKSDNEWKGGINE